MCAHRMWGDPDGLECSNEDPDHVTHTYALGDHCKASEPTGHDQ